MALTSIYFWESNDKNVFLTLDLQPRNRAVHNFSGANFSKRATTVLGLGFLKIPTNIEVT